mmetsp:Transcript_20372/g.31062  ORF Transcript_20372/g.31062 Transcript_20372/m.31062 type:complete len:127 (+) Transcript_20372:67-447(+)
MSKALVANSMNESPVTEKKVGDDNEEEDYAALIYQESVRRKREAAAIKKIASSSTPTHQTSTGTRTIANAAGRICSANGCTNIVKKGGVCIRHGAKIKHARAKDAQTKSSEEESAISTEQSASPVK